MNGFTKIDNRAMVAILTRLGQGEFVVYSILRMHCGSADRSRPSIPKIAAESGLSEASVHRHLKSLEAASVITKAVSPGKPTEYILASPLSICDPSQIDTPLKLRVDPCQIESHPCQNERGLTYKKTHEEDTRKEGERPPAREAVIRYGEAIGLTTSEAEQFFDYWDAVGWRKKGQPILHWDSECKLWQSRQAKINADKPPPRGTGPPGGHTLQSMKDEIGQQLRDQGIF